MKRKGAGKKNLLNKAGRLPQIQVTLIPEDVAKIDMIAEKAGLTRSSLVRNLVKSALDDAMALNAIGVIDIVGLIRRRNDQKPERTAAARPRARTAPATG